MDVSITNNEGNILISSNPELVGSNVAHTQYFINAQSQSPQYPTLPGRQPKQMLAVLTLPMSSNLGYMVMSSDLADVAKHTTNRISFGKTGNGFVYNADGVQIMHREQKYIGDNDSSLDWVSRMLSTKKGSLEYDWHGVAKLAAFDSSSSLNWTVAIVVEKDDILSGVSMMMRHTIFTAVVITSIVAGIIVFMSLNVSHALTSCVNFTRHITSGNITITPEQSRPKPPCWTRRKPNAG